jgi:SulP family sulfate permease
MLLNATGMETSTRQELDVDRELRSVGIANLISAAGGGMVGFPSLSATMLANRMGAVSRLVGVVIAAFFAAVILAGPSLVAMFPKVVLGGLLCYLGLSMMADWVYDGLSRMQRSDYAIIIIILAAVAAIGYLEGIVIGIVVAVALFVVDYSRLTVIKASYSGAHFRSNVERPFHHRRQLHADGDKLFILQLEGYLFFGTANTMLNRIIERLRDPESQPLHYLVLDFSRIRRLDSSAIQSLSKIRQTVEAQGITLIFAGVAQQISAIIKKNDFDLTESQSFRQMPDSDTAIEWCEERLLREARVTNILRSETLREHINAIFPDLLPFDDLARYLEALQVSAGDYLAHQGEPSDAMFFVEAGKIRVQLESAGAEPLQLRKVHAGAILGEVSIYSEKPRSASLVVDEDGVVYRLSSEALRRMESEDQALATAFHKFIAHVLAERLADMTEALDVALR